MELTIKINLDSKTHSKYHNVEASLWLYYLSQHLDKNFDDEKLEKILNEKNFIYSQGKNKKKIGFYKFENKKIEKEKTEAEITADLNKWSRKHFGYVENGVFKMDD
tara:strand:+ start:287 stop:604 length:318 start_codon:yes stop_codon:yes gene_type:complete